MATACRHCGSPRLKFHKRMTNVDKWLCKICGKFTFFRGPYRRKVRLAVQEAARNSYTMYNHQKKGNAFVDALAKYSKWEQINEASLYRGLKFVLTDSDIMGRVHRLQRQKKAGCELFFVIPHTARPNIINDIIPRWIGTTAQFVVSRGHAEVMRAYGYDLPLHPIGWNLCPMRKFTPRQAAREVLFAPIHPRCHEIDKKVNRATFDKLYKLAQSDDIKLTVRFIRNLAESGLTQVHHPNVVYTSGHMNQDYNQIDNADVVVSHQTAAYLAVARGVPTVMMAETTLPTHIQKRGAGSPLQKAKNWSKYVDLLAYPLDILQEDDTLGLLNRAVSSDAEISHWRTRLIGSPFKARRFVEIINGYAQ